MEDRILLSVLKHKEQYLRLLPYIRLEIQEPYTRHMIKEFGQYFDEKPDATVVDTVEFYMWQTQFRMKRIKEEDRAKLKAVLSAIQPDPDGDTRALLLKGFQEREFATKLMELTQTWEDGGEVALFDEARDLFVTHSESLKRQVKDPWVKADFETLFDMEKLLKESLPWCVPQLNLSIGPAPLSQFYIFAGRPDSGKTTFVSDNLRLWGAEAYKKWGLDRPILIFNNEGASDKYQRRIVQSGLNMTTPELINKGWKWANEMFSEMVCPFGNDNMADDLIRVMQIPGYGVKDLEFIIEDHNPCAVVYDMLDNVKGFESLAKYGTVDMRFEYLYQWGREMAIEHNHFALGLSQMNGEAEGMEYPTLNMLKGSTTAKQGACDVIIMGGRGDISDTSRYLSTPKNKSELRDPDADPVTMAQVATDFARGRYYKEAVPSIWDD